MIRRHGWERPLHPLQIVGMAVYSFLLVVFYTFLGIFLGNRVAEITVTTIYSVVAISVMLLFIRCTAINPTDKTSFRKKKKPKSKGFAKLNYGFILSEVVMRFFRRLERKILKTFIRRKYLDPMKTNAQIEPLLPFPFFMNDDDAAIPDPRDDDLSYCSLCDFEVKKHSKHCRTCNRCVEGFDHHCRWLNNCIGKRNYTTFILLMTSVLLMLIIEGGTAVAVFVRCFADKNVIERELKSKLYLEFPSEVLATISGMRTYDYILAMKEENQSMEMDSFDISDSDFSSDSDYDSPKKSRFVSNFTCGGHKRDKDPAKLSIRIDKEPEPSNLTKKQGFHVSINPWKLITLSRDKALLAAEKARERLLKQKTEELQGSVRPLPLETKRGPLSEPEKNTTNMETSSRPIGRVPASPGRFSSPRRRFSGSPTIFSGIVPSPKSKYRSSFDLKLTEVSRELETYISKQVLCSVMKKDACEASPR